MRWLSCAALAVGAVTISAAQAPAQLADLVLRDGKVIMLDGCRPPGDSDTAGTRTDAIHAMPAGSRTSSFFQRM